MIYRGQKSRPGKIHEKFRTSLGVTTSNGTSSSPFGFIGEQIDLDKAYYGDPTAHSLRPERERVCLAC
jgi:hypothetical protein